MPCSQLVAAPAREKIPHGIAERPSNEGLSLRTNVLDASVVALEVGSKLPDSLWRTATTSSTSDVSVSEEDRH